MPGLRGDRVVLNLAVSRALRRQLKLLAVKREMSLRQLAREALEETVARGAGALGDTSVGGGDDRVQRD